MAIVSKSNKKLATRALFGIAFVGLAIAALNYLRSLGTDIDPGTFDSKGSVVALKQTDEGFQAVIVKSDGTVLESPGYAVGSQDVSPIWNLDGNRVFFASDRDNREPHLFRWNPGRNVVDRRSLDRRSKNNLSVYAKYPDGVLMVSGGTVIMLDPHKSQAYQVLPPQSRSMSGETQDEGGRGQFEQMYDQLGTSFRDAKWCGDGEWIVAVMRREEGGEVLVLQAMGTDAEGKPIPVMPVLAGDKIDFDVSKDGTVVFTCMNFQYLDDSKVPPESRVNGKIVRPFAHIMGTLLPGSAPPKMSTIVVTPDDKACFNRPRVTEDGKFIVCAVGPYNGEGAQEVKTLVVFPNVPGGAGAKAVAGGDITDFNWSKDGERIYFTVKMNDQKPICYVGKDGGEPTVLTKSGKFRNPIPSPQ